MRWTLKKNMKKLIFILNSFFETGRRIILRVIKYIFFFTYILYIYTGDEMQNLKMEILHQGSRKKVVLLVVQPLRPSPRPSSLVVNCHIGTFFFFQKFEQNSQTNLPKKLRMLPTDNIIKQDRKIVKVKYLLLTIWNT